MNRLLALGFLFSPLASASAAEKVVVVKTADAPVIAELASGFKSAFPGSPADEVLFVDGGEAALAKRLSGATVVLSVGPKAATAVAGARATGHTIAVVPGAQADPKRHGPTMRLQPPSDGIITAVAWLGQYKRVGLVTDSKERLDVAKVAASSRGLTLVGVAVAGARDVAPAVTGMLKSIDVLVIDVTEGMGLQDVQSILRTADTEKIPVIGTSEGFIKAGAPMAIAIDPRNVGAEAGRLAASKASGLFDPRRFRLLVNLVVTQRLGLSVPQDKGIVANNILTMDVDAAELAQATSRPVAVAGGGGVATKPTITKQGRLIFPSQTGLRQAEVVLEVEVKADGSLGTTKVVRGDQLFADAAVTSLRSWQFKPGTNDGKPVDGTLRLNLKFQK